MRGNRPPRAGVKHGVYAMVQRMKMLSFALVLALGAALLAGCSDGTPETVRTVLPINAMAFNDSVAGGDTLYLKVQYTYGSTCEQNARFEVVSLGSSTYGVTTVAIYGAEDKCTGVNGTAVATLRVTDLGTGALTFSVAGSNTILTANVQASTDTAFVTYPGTTFRVRAENVTTGALIPNAHIEIRNVVDNSVVTEGFTDANGIFAYDRPCGPDLSYVVSAGADGRVATMVVRTPPARCGFPEYVVIRV